MRRGKELPEAMKRDLLVQSQPDEVSRVQKAWLAHSRLMKPFEGEP